MKTIPLLLTLATGMLAVDARVSLAWSGIPDTAVSFAVDNMGKVLRTTGTVRTLIANVPHAVSFADAGKRAAPAKAGSAEPQAPGTARERNIQDSICSLVSLVQHGQLAPGTGGGTFNPVAFINPTTVNSSGLVAFNSQVSGSSRNQGVFTADSNGISAIAIGCGGGGGSGDPGTGCGDSTPVGGTYSGFFSGTFFTPDINDAGDVLFFCDVHGGTSSRGLFLYRSADQRVVKVAAVGDPSPIGGTFNAVGPGSLNNNGKAVFLASPVGEMTSNIFLWSNGSVTKVAAVGDPAPGGGTFSFLGTESAGFLDGTNIPVGPVPDINDEDQICFRAIVSGGTVERGIIVRTGSVDQWYIKAADPTPTGGTYLDMQAASINNAGQIAFFADYRPTPSTVNSGWFAGAPANWRKVIVFSDSIDGGQCNGLAFSRNPMQTIDAEGNVVFWTDINSSGGADRLVLGMEEGGFLVVVRRGEQAPGGGSFGSMDAWPAVNALRGTIDAATPGGALNAHMLFNRCSPVASAPEQEETPGAFRLGQNYPNPFNPSTRIDFDLSRQSHVKLEVYNTLGQSVALVINEVRQAGHYSVGFDGGNLGSGVYFYRLQAGGFVQTRKLVVLR